MAAREEVAGVVVYVPEALDAEAGAYIHPLFTST
jgi:hypothetical protein